MTAKINFGTKDIVLKEFLGVETFGKAPAGLGIKRVMIIDTETTGRNTATCELVELALNIIEFDMDGNFYDILFKYEAKQEIKGEFDRDASTLTGLTKEELIGESIDFNLVTELLDKVDAVVSFNASFDRPILHRYCDAFKNKFWMCAFAEIPWIQLFGGGGSQELLVQKICKMHYDSHGAMADIEALSVLLNTKVQDKTLFYVLLKMAAAKKERIFAYNSPYESKDVLRDREYYWDSNKRVWFKDISLDNVSKEKEFLVGLGSSPDTMPINGFNKFY